MAISTVGANGLNKTEDFTIDGLTVGKGNGGLTQNTAVGNAALAGANSGVGHNTAVGYQAINANTTGTNLDAVGAYVLAKNTTGIVNTAMGGSNTTPALYNNTTGGYNVAYGNGSLFSNTTGSGNVGIGFQAGYTSQLAGNNTFVGYQAGATSNPSGTTYGNTCVGAYAGFSLTTGVGNSFLGGTGYSACGYGMTTGSKNTFVGGYGGNQAGLDLRTSSNNIVLSDGDGNPRLYFSGNTWYNTPVANVSHQVIEPSGQGSYLVTGHAAGAGTGYSYHIFTVGGTTIGQIAQSGASSVSYATTSDYRLKENISPMRNALAAVQQLKPVTYKWKADGVEGQGFIAHELAEVVPDCVVGEKDAVDADGNPIYQSIDTSFLVATLTAAIQELKAEFDAYKASHP